MEKPGTSTVDAAKKVNKLGTGTGKVDIKVDELDTSIALNDLGINIGRVDAKDKLSTGIAAKNIGIGRVDTKKVDKLGISIIAKNSGTSRADAIEVDKPGTARPAEDLGIKDDLSRSSAEGQSVTRRVAARASLLFFHKALCLIFSSLGLETYSYSSFSFSFLSSISTSVKQDIFFYIVLH